ncbi:hypothetical protein SAMN04488025_13713 [Planifilum fulgidum]|uniref:Uncharacterized protein n=1 Tax=Planifilum fulgidum TaxID=201973 RepID=A0A1I2S2E5_9BACL|nr:hypothetical protein SAMN04488025_13713 [Planifilum fulgidum]
MENNKAARSRGPRLLTLFVSSLFKLRGNMVNGECLAMVEGFKM